MARGDQLARLSTGWYLAKLAAWLNPRTRSAEVEEELEDQQRELIAPCCHRLGVTVSRYGWKGQRSHRRLDNWLQRFWIKPMAALI